jgi:hypothetical protein
VFRGVAPPCDLEDRVVVSLDQTELLAPMPIIEE